MRKSHSFRHNLLILTMMSLAMGLVYYARVLPPMPAALIRYLLFIPVIYAAHFYGINGGITVSLCLSTLLLPIAARALNSQAPVYGAETAVVAIALNLTGYFWGALAGAQRRQRQLYQELHELSKQVTLEPKVTAASILDAALANVPSAGGLILLSMDPEFALRVLASRGLSQAETDALEAEIDTDGNLVRWAFTQTPGTVINRLAGDPRFTGIGPEAPSNLLVAPLHRGEEVCGCILLFDSQGAPDFSRADLEWVARLAERASVALENARLYMVSQAVAEENARYYKELKVYANELDRLVAERTKALTKALADLREAEADLLQTSRMAAVGELAGRVAHEILNPLTGILGRVQTRMQAPAADQGQPIGIMQAILGTWQEKGGQPGGLMAYFGAPSPTTPGLSCGQEDLRDLEQLIGLEQELVAQHLHDLGFIETQTLRLVKMVESLRELGRRTRTVRAVDLGQTVREAAEVMQPIVEKARVQLSLEIPADLPAVTADPDELVQVFTNLLHNAAQAVEATGRGSGKVSVVGVLNKNKVELRFSDDGIGIPPENYEKVFDAGFTTKPREQGTGLGLNISRHFVRECHGDVLIETSVVGQGTTFLTWFPTPEEVGREPKQKKK